jgi:hypothetical protein
MSYITGFYAVRLLTINHIPTILLCNFTEPHEMHVANKVKIKCTIVQALRFCRDRTAHRESRGIALPFHDHGTRRG